MKFYLLLSLSVVFIFNINYGSETKVPFSTSSQVNVNKLRTNFENIVKNITELTPEEALEKVNPFVDQDIDKEIKWKASWYLAELFAYDEDPDFDLARDYAREAVRAGGEMSIEAIKLLKYIIKEEEKLNKTFIKLPKKIKKKKENKKLSFNFCFSMEELYRINNEIAQLEQENSDLINLKQKLTSIDEQIKSNQSELENIDKQIQYNLRRSEIFNQKKMEIINFIKF